MLLFLMSAGLSLSLKTSLLYAIFFRTRVLGNENMRFGGCGCGRGSYVVFFVFLLG